MGRNHSWPLPVVALLFLALPADGRPPEEPHWNSKPLSHWLRALTTTEVAGRVEAADSVAEIAIVHGGSAAAAAVPALVANLDVDDAAVRRSAARALEHIGPAAKPAVPSLVLMLSADAEPASRRGAALALGRIDATERQVVLQAGRALRDPDAGVRVSAGVVLMAAGSAALPSRDALDAALSDADPIVRLYAAAAIGRSGAPDRAAPLLLEAMRSSERMVRAECAGLLVDLAPGRPSVLQTLASALKDPEPEVRVAAADALGAIGRPARPVLDALWPLLRDPDEGVRDSVVRAATLIRD